MENNTLGFFIGIQNLCISHNKTITSLQWILGNLFLIISSGLAIWFYYVLRIEKTLKAYKKGIISYWIFSGIFFLVYNTVSLSLPIDELEAMEEVIRNKPELSEKVINEIHQLKSLGNDLH